MDLDELIRGLGIEPAGRRVAGAVRITDITEDSRTVMPGSLFIARQGEKSDGRRFIADAERAGAAAVLVERADGPPPSGAAPVLVCDDVALATAQLAERFYGEPSSALTCVGITGTNGKTTTAWLVHQLLNGAGTPHGGAATPPMRCGLMGTVVVDDGVEIAPASLTTAPALEVSRTLARMLESGCRAAALEASSHALHQKRVAAPGGVRFRVGVFTNLTRDHLDYHKTMDAYAESKALLFSSLPPDGVAIVNADDPAHTRMLAGCRAKVVRCSTRSRPAPGAPPADWIGRIESMTAAGMVCELDGPWHTAGNAAGSGPWKVRLPLVGGFNLMNAMQAAAVAYELGLDAALIREGLAHAQAPPGRLERVTGWDDPWAAYVDYAHTDDALERVLTVLREVLAAAAWHGGVRGTPGRLVVVFGCGGNRDKGKRPRMGEVAARLADRVIITSDNPRLEDPRAIIDDILAGIPPVARAGIPPVARAGIVIEPDRRAAIGAAVAELLPRDLLVVAGKGHEDYQILPDGKGGTVRRTFDDREVTRAALAQRREGRGAGGGGGEPA